MIKTQDLNSDTLKILNIKNSKESLVENFNKAFYFTIGKDGNTHRFAFTIPDIEQDDFMKGVREITLSMTWWQENSSYNYQIDGVKITGLTMDCQGAISLIYGEEIIKHKIDKKSIGLYEDNMLFCKSQSIDSASFIEFMENGLQSYINPYLKSIGVRASEQIYTDINDKFNDFFQSLSENKSLINFVSDSDIHALNSTIYDYETIKLNNSLQAELSVKDAHKAQKI